MGRVWSEESKLQRWLDVELAACEAWSELGQVPGADLESIRRRASFEVESVKERERVTNHDMAAFVDVVSESIGEPGRWVHYGLTSSDVLDTALALQIKEAGTLLIDGINQYLNKLKDRAREFKDTLCVGRTHGVHAEPMTFGLKLAGFALETERNLHRVEAAIGQASVGKLSGAVGTYSATSPEFERIALGKLGLKPEPIATQVVARDRHAQLLQALSLTAASLERFATEIRHLQRTEVREVEEPFGRGQKGSSAMPHKRNPITCERICGLARVIRGNVVPALENVALWHERDISHSSVERVIIPDSFIALDYMLNLALDVTGEMTVHKDRMRQNLEITSGALFSQPVLSALVEAGLERDDAYRIVQHHAQRAWDQQRPFRELLADDPEVADVLDKKDLEQIFRYERFFEHLPEVFERL